MNQHDLIHLLKIKGKASVADLAEGLGSAEDEVTSQLSVLADCGVADERPAGRRPGWILTPLGQEKHAEQLAAEQRPDVLAALDKPYQTFLRHNAGMKRGCAQWHQADDEFTQFEIIRNLTDINTQVAPALREAGAEIPRFARYADRLDRALDRAGLDPRYVVSPLVDSFHTVWFECHEDFLMLLGISRAQEGSY